MTSNSADFIAGLRQMVERANSEQATCPDWPRDLLHGNCESPDSHRASRRVGFGVSGNRGGSMLNMDFVAKLRQIEEQANAAIAELPAGMAKTRVQHIVVLAKTLRGRLEFGAVTVVPTDPDAKPGAQAPA